MTFCTSVPGAVRRDESPTSRSGKTGRTAGEGPTSHLCTFRLHPSTRQLRVVSPTLLEAQHKTRRLSGSRVTSPTSLGRAPSSAVGVVTRRTEGPQQDKNRGSTISKRRVESGERQITKARDPPVKTEKSQSFPPF